MILEPWQWALAVAAAIFVGVSKTAIGGLGMVAVTIVANLMPAKEAIGFVLPLLICGDLVAVAAYRAHTQWRHVIRLFPWAAVGVVLGWLTMERINDRQAALLIGTIVLAMVALFLWRRRRGGEQDQHGMVFAATIGILAGFTSLIANAAGPLMAIYLLAMGLPKMKYMGTGAVFFFIFNVFKVPFMMNLGLINGASLSSNLLLVPVVFVGAFIGRSLLKRINQRLFENLALWTSAIAGVKLML